MQVQVQVQVEDALRVQVLLIDYRYLSDTLLNQPHRGSKDACGTMGKQAGNCAAVCILLGQLNTLSQNAVGKME